MKTLLFIYFALVLITFTACQPSGKEAIVAGNNACITDPAACGSNGVVNGSAYQNNQGYYPYGYGTNSSIGYSQPFNYYNNNAYLCNCPNGTIPTYNGSAGLGCVTTSRVSSKIGFSGFFYLSWGNNQWNNLPQLYKYKYGGGSNSCYNGAVQSCSVGHANSCPSGYLCRPSDKRSNLGLCVASHR